MIENIANADIIIKEIGTYSKKSIFEKNISSAINEMKKELVSSLEAKVRFPIKTKILGKQIELTKNILFLELINNEMKSSESDLVKIIFSEDKSFIDYLYKDNHHFEIIDNIDKRDDIDNVFKILNKLFKLDSSNKYFKL